MSRRLREGLQDRLKVLSPFGLGLNKPRHFRDMGGVIWKNRDNLPYAWKVLSQGVCDGCALGVAGFKDWTIDSTHLCMTRLNLLRLNTCPPFNHELLADVSSLKAMNNSELRELGRLAHPMIRAHGEAGFRRISWDQAYARMAECIKTADPDQLAFFLTSRGITNEVYYVAQKVARFLGTNNVDNAARICHSPSTAAMKQTLGVAATTCSYKDWYGSDLIVFFGANPANDQPVTTKYLHEAKKQGTKVVIVNPYLEPGLKRYWVPSSPGSMIFGTKIADYWFPVSKGGDIAFIYGVMKVLFEEGWYDKKFVEGHSEGVDQLRAATADLSWETLEKQAGMSRDDMREFAQLMRDAETAVFVWSMGITQHAFGSNNVQMILNLGLLKGYVGRDKCGLMPIRGHSGVQGGAEMGAYATAFPGGVAINKQNAATFSDTYGFNVPDKPGLTAPNMVEACARGELKMLYCMGGNFLRTLPEPDYVARAMANVPLRVHQDIILTDQMFIDPAREGYEVLLLPGRTRYEQEGGGTQTTTERRVMFSPELPREVGEARSEWRIFLELAHAVDAERAAKLGCETGQAIRNEIAEVIPMYKGIEKLVTTGDAFQYGGPHLCKDWKFNTEDGKAHFHAVPLPDLDREPGVYEVATRRGKQFNSLVYAEIDPFNQAPRDAVLMNVDDAAALHLKQSDRIKLVNKVGEYEGRVHLAPIARGNLQIHWPEGNVIIAKGIEDEGGGVPDYNAQVRIEKISA